MFIYLLCLAGSLVFIYFLPELWWEISWGELFKIIGNKDDATKLANSFSNLIEDLGLTDTNLHTWAVERLLICLAIGIAIIIFITVIYKIFKKDDKKSNQPKTIKEENDTLNKENKENKENTLNTNNYETINIDNKEEKD